MKIGPEAIEQIKILNWLSSAHPLARKLIIRIGNEGRHTVIGHSINKKLGLNKGASDLFLPINNGKYNGLFIEVKKDGWKCSGKKETEHIDEQLNFISLMKIQGYWGEIIVGCNEGIECIKKYLNLA